MKQPQIRKHSQKRNGLRPGTAGYSITLGILLYVTLHYLLMLLCIAPGNPELARDALIVISLIPALTVIMLIGQIRWWIRTGTGPDLKGKAAAAAGWFHRFLFRVRTGFRPITDPPTENQKMTARFRDSLDDLYQHHQDAARVTQMYGNLLILHRRRLERLGLRIQSSYQAMQVNGLKDCTVTRVRDGRLNHTSIQEHLRTEKKILHGSRTVYCYRGNTDSVCDIIGVSHGGEARGAAFICPDCGAVSTMTELIKGCPYCGTAFLMEELQDRVCSFSTSSSPEMDEALFHLRLGQIINWIAFLFAVIEILFGFFPMMYEVFIVERAELYEFPFALFLSFSSTLLLFFIAVVFNWTITLPVRAIGHKIYQKRREKRSLDHQVMERNRQILPEVRQKDPQFSMESFFSNVRNKIAAIHYSGKYQQADVFTSADLSAAVEQYKDVAECIWGPMELISFEVEGDYKTAIVETWLTLLRWDGGKIIKSGEKLRLQLKRYRKETRENPFGIHVPVCSHCGASVNLLSGNRCAHCGRELNFMHLDWCITAYQQLQG